jgi:hypothetical protein
MTLDEWVAQACRELGLDPADARTQVVLDLARDVAHQVLRPAAPVTAYLLGVAVGRGADPEQAAAHLSALAAAASTHPAATSTEQAASTEQPASTEQAASTESDA